MLIEMQGGVHESSAGSAMSPAEKMDCFLPSLAGLVTCGRPESSVKTLGYYQNVPAGQNITGKAVYYAY
jgi:hypothetical protein